MNQQIQKIIDLFNKKQKEYYESQNRIQPVHSNRASALGHPCLRYLVYLRTRWQDQLKPEIQVIRYFTLGKELEKIIMKKLIDMGIEIYEMQRAFHDPQFNISGLIDAKIKIDYFVFPAEIKSLSQFHFDSLNTAQDFKTHKQHYIRGYYTQLQIYLYLESVSKQEFEPFGVFILVNKQDGNLKIIPVEFDFDEVEQALRKAEAVEKHIKEQTLPERIDDLKVCEKCPFRHICLPEIKSNVDFVLSDEIKGILERYHELKQIIERYDEIYAEYELLKSQLKELFKEKIDSGTEQILVGDYMIKGKKVITKRVDTSQLPPEIKSQYTVQQVSYRIDVVKIL